MDSTNQGLSKVQIVLAPAPEKGVHLRRSHTVRSEDHHLALVVQGFSSFPQSLESSGVHRIWPGIFPKVVEAFRFSQQVLVHVEKEAPLLWHAPADAPLVGECGVVALVAESAFIGRCRTRAHSPAVGPQPFNHVGVDDGQLLNQIIDANLYDGMPR